MRGKIFYFVNHTANFDGNGGIQRVTRHLGRALRERGRDVVFVSWLAQARAAIRSTDDELCRLARWHGPAFRSQGATGQPLEATDKDDVLGSWLLVPECPYHTGCATRALIDYAHRVGMKIAFIFYDLIPIKIRGYEHLREVHAAYVEDIVAADLIIPISRYSGAELQRYCVRTLGLPATELPQIACCPLPEELPEHPRVDLAGEPAKDSLEIVSLGLIEPRKNQCRLLRAFNRFCDTHPDLPVRLTLIGDHDPEELRRVTKLARLNPRVVLAGRLSAEDIAARYDQCHFTVFPSIEEGFGLPISESLWLGKPCLCADFGAMAEVAAGGGCLTVDTRSVTALAAGIERLSLDRALRQRLAREAAQRPMRSWGDYAEAIAGALDRHVAIRRACSWVEHSIDVVIRKGAGGVGTAEAGRDDDPHAALPAPDPTETRAVPIRPGTIADTIGQGWMALRTRLLAPLRDWRAMRVIARSGLFDRVWYLQNNPDVAAAAADPIRHYVSHGAGEGRDPSPAFNTRRYTALVPDVELSGINPFAHFILHGARQEPTRGGITRRVFSSYAAWQRARVIARLAANPPADQWNHLITVVIFDDDSDDADRFSATLASLHAQHYRNIEVMLVGVPRDLAAGPGDFSGHRGMFVEPSLDPFDILASPATDRLWRGSHLLFARAGTQFAPDAFQLINAALNPACGDVPDLVVCDHDRLGASGELTAPSCGPGWDPDLIGALDYIETAFLASRALVLARRSAGRPASLHDWLCGIARSLPQPSIAHVAEPLVHMPAAAPQPTLRCQTPVVPAAAGGELPGMAIVIPNRNKPELLGRCIRFLDLPCRFRPELVIVGNASDDPAVEAIYDDLRLRHGASIVRMNQPFNFSRMVNLGVAASRAEVVLLLDNDVEITAPELLEQMLAHAQRPEVGVVGSRLLYPDGTVQHAGMLLRPDAADETCVRAYHVMRGAPGAAAGYLHQLRTVRNYQCVTGALMAVRRDVFDRVGGFDEVSLPVELNDVDFCLKVRRAGWRVIVLPLDGAVHLGAADRAIEDAAAKEKRTAAMAVIRERWPEAVARDPYCNPWVDVAGVPQACFPWQTRAAS